MCSPYNRIYCRSLYLGFTRFVPPLHVQLVDFFWIGNGNEVFDEWEYRI